MTSGCEIEAGVDFLENGRIPGDIQGDAVQAL